ncbi:hypothetical protein PS1_009412 [Malus domestica]
MASAICGRPLTFFTSRSRSHNHPSDQMPVFLLLDSSSPIAVRLVIKGRVQGVFYGDCTVRDATELGLKGWVRNRIDGSLEHCFPGTLMQLKRWSRGVAVNIGSMVPIKLTTTNHLIWSALSTQMAKDPKSLTQMPKGRWVYRTMEIGDKGFWFGHWRREG